MDLLAACKSVQTKPFCEAAYKSTGLPKPPYNLL